MDEYLQTEKKPEMNAAKVARAKRLGEYTSKWMNGLLWLAIPNAIANILTMNVRMAEVPLFYNIGSIIGFICMGLEIFFFVKLHFEEEEYFTAARFGTIAIILFVVSEVFYRIDGGGVILYLIALFINCAAVVLFCLRIYHECYAHASVMLSVDKEMVEKWVKLWKWQVIGYAGITLGTLLQVYQRLDRVLLTVQIGMILSVVMPFVAGIAGLFRLVYLEKSKKLLREYAKKYDI